METSMWLAATLAIALAGGIVGYKLKLPAGALLCAMIFVVTFNLLTDKGYFYSNLRVGVQILSGVMIGSRIGKKDIIELRQMIFPIVILIIGMVVLNVSFGLAIYSFSSLDVPTSLFASAPGGVSDMAMISEDLGANPSYVAVLQIFRQLTIYSCYPVLLKKVVVSYRKRKGTVENVEQANVHVELALAGRNLENEEKRSVRIPLSDNVRKLLVLIIVGGFGGLVLLHLKVVAGALFGSMILSAALSIFRGKVRFPRKLRVVMQSVSGAYLGVLLNRHNIMQMGELIIPALIMFVGIFMFVFVIGLIMHRITGLDISTCLLSSTPGGLSEMALLSEDLGADTPKIAIMQTARIFMVVLLFPTMNAFILHIFYEL